MDRLEAPDLRPTRAFPSAIEIAGLVAALAPFAIHSATTSWRTENGHVVDFVYRDWIAVGGGAVAVAAAIFAFASIARTDAAKRMPRILTAVALLGLGGWHGLRGFGVAGVDRPRDARPVETSAEPREPAVTKQAAAVVGKPARDASTWAHLLFDRWNADHLDAMVTDVFGTRSEGDDARRLFDVAHEQLGEARGVTEAQIVTLPSNATVVAGTVAFEHGPAHFELNFWDDGTPWYLELDPPKELEPAIAQLVTPETADRDARAFFTDVIEGKWDAAAPLCDPKLIANTTADSKKAAADFLSKAGKLRGFDVTANDADHIRGRDLTYTIHMSKGPLTGTIQMYPLFGRWQITDWNLEPAAPER